MCRKPNHDYLGGAIEILRAVECDTAASSSSSSSSVTASQEQVASNLETHAPANPRPPAKRPSECVSEAPAQAKRAKRPTM